MKSSRVVSVPKSRYLQRLTDLRSFSSVVSILVLSLILSVAGGSELRAQSVTSGDIVGVVTDPSGAVLLNTRVTLKSQENGSTQTQSTNEPAKADLIKYGKTLYKQEGCFMCHQLNGEGAAVGPDLTVEGTRSRTNEWLIGHFKDPSAYVPGSVMPAFKNLTDEQLRALTTLLQNQK